MEKITERELEALQYVEKWARGGAPLVHHQQEAAIVAAALRRMLRILAALRPL